MLTVRGPLENFEVPSTAAEVQQPNPAVAVSAEGEPAGAPISAAQIQPELAQAFLVQEEPLLPATNEATNSLPVATTEQSEKRIRFLDEGMEAQQGRGHMLLLAFAGLCHQDSKSPFRLRTALEPHWP